MTHILIVYNHLIDHIDEHSMLVDFYNKFDYFYLK